MTFRAWASIMQPHKPEIYDVQIRRYRWFRYYYELLGWLYEYKKHRQFRATTKALEKKQ